MKKKEYEKPMTIVIELQNGVKLLQASGQAGAQDYNENPYHEE